jgi:L-fuculose-phosphate aldolase
MSSDPRRELAAGLQELGLSGLNSGTSGNVSLRSSEIAERFWITPTGMDPRCVGAEDVVELTLDGSAGAGRRPSSEWPMHAAIYRGRADVSAIVHTHSPFATALASARRGIPAFHYMVAVAGGSSIRCAQYATFGSVELGEHATAALDGRRACLLANHGAIAVGGSLRAALALARQVEELAAQYWRTLQLGPPVLLDEEEMRRVSAKFSSYGQQHS